MASAERSIAPFFVIGSPRSGTTMLRLMLTSHPQLVVPPECGFALWLHPTFSHWGVAEFSAEDTVSKFADAIASARKFVTWGLSRDEVSRAILQYKPSSYAEACDAIYRLFVSHTNKQNAVWGDKNNFYLAHVTALKAIFSQGRFLHIARDGRDVACSYREVMSLDSSSPYRPVLPVEISEIATQWASDIRGIRDQFALLDPADKCELRYEDLTANPTQELSRICDWLGVNFAPDMLKFHHANRQSQLEPAATMEWKQRTLHPASQTTVGRHTKMLNALEAAEFIAIAGAELRIYNYLQ